MKLEQISLNAPRVEIKSLDLKYLTASPFYGSGDVQLGGGKCLPRFNSDKDSEGIFKPIGTISDFKPVTYFQNEPAIEKDNG